MFAAAGHTSCTWSAVRARLLGRLGTRPGLLTTDARPERVQEDVRGPMRCGIPESNRHRRRKTDHRMEITTSGSRQKHDRVSRHPEVSAIAFEGDLVRRDFTTNATAVRVTATGRANSDPLGGLAALRAKVPDTGAGPWRRSVADASAARNCPAT